MNPQIVATQTTMKAPNIARRRLADTAFLLRRGGRGRGMLGSARSRGSGRELCQGGAGYHSGSIYKEDVPARLPPQLQPASLQRLVNNFKSSAIISPKRPLRPGYGALGVEINLRTNYFAMELPNQLIFSYVVTISPNPSAEKRARIFQLLEQNPLLSPPIAHDRSQRLVSSKTLPQPLHISVPFYDEHNSDTGSGRQAKTYDVSIELDREIDPNELKSYMEGQLQFREFDTQTPISALNIILQQHSNTAGLRSGKGQYFFPTTLPKESIGHNLDAVRGFYCSVRPGFKQLLVNIDQCMAPFVKPGNLADKLLQFRPASPGAMPTLPETIVRHLKVRAKHLGYKKSILAVGSTSARQTFFDCPKYGGMISVEGYFMKEYNIKLKHPDDLPVINVGSQTKAVWLPAELCEIEEGNIYRGKLNDKETSQMIKVTCNPPITNAENIVNVGFPSLGLMPPQKPISNFGINISNEMYVVPGRVLPYPEIKYRAGTLKSQNARWSVSNNKFYSGANLNAGWWVLVVQDGSSKAKNPNLQNPNLQEFVGNFQRVMVSKGMTVPHAPIILPTAKLISPAKDPERKESAKIIKAVLEQQLKAQGGKKPSFVLVVLESKEMYPWIKRLGDIEMGIHTVHIHQFAKAMEENTLDQYFTSVAFKVNTKLGGVNHLLVSDAMDWLKKVPTMMVGIDVTHPKDSHRGVPSIAAVVASVDDQFVQFPASLRLQRANKVKEILDELKEMMVERLAAYQKENKSKLPERIFVYRDGVSETQFDAILDEELPQILAAFEQFDDAKSRKQYRPKLSIVICCKRHHTRFFPTDSKFADKNGNSLPGTVVSKGITGVFDFSFFLQAHTGARGQIRSTNYVVIYDENKLSADNIEHGTHHASYLYARTTHAVSLIPAAYYADLACERGRYYLNEIFMEDEKTGEGKKGSEEERNRVYEAAKGAWGQGLHPDMRGSMFYI